MTTTIYLSSYDIQNIRDIVSGGGSTTTVTVIGLSVSVYESENGGKPTVYTSEVQVEVDASGVMTIIIGSRVTRGVKVTGCYASTTDCSIILRTEDGDYTFERYNHLFVPHSSSE